MLLAFTALAVPLALGALETVGQLARNSRVYDSRLSGMYNASAGLEAALHDIINDPNFDDGLTTTTPSKAITVESNGQIATATVTMIFTDGVEGQGLVPSKEVTPTTTPVNTETTFTYTTGSTGGITTSEPSDITSAGDVCGQGSYSLTWDLSQYVQVTQGQELTLSFQATAQLADGAYYNQARVRYDPWWNSPDIHVWTPHTAEVTVGTGTPKCGSGMDLLVTKPVDPPDAPPWVETEFTYTITIENTTSETRYVCQIEDLLPPDFTYVAGSSGDYPANIDTSEPSLSWRPTWQRWRLQWNNGGGAAAPLTDVAPGATKTQVIRAMATLESGVNYFNEVNVSYATSGGSQACNNNEGVGSGTGQGQAGNSSSVEAPPVYDIAAVAEDGSIQARIVFWKSDGVVEILSWQEY